ncbi:hypothetical protein ACFL1E_06740 [Candidatus Omnitrophota bacterium]
MEKLTPVSDHISLHTRQRKKSSSASSDFEVIEQTITLDPKETAVIVVDMWDQHWCKKAQQRIEELAPAIDEFVKQAREKSISIIHAPSDTQEFYRNHPARKHAKLSRVQSAFIKRINRYLFKRDFTSWCEALDAEPLSEWPIDDSKICDDPSATEAQVWTKQIDAIEIHNQDILSTSAIEIWHVFKKKRIKNLLYVGVHVNQCVLARPFGLRNMSKCGKNVVLVRDLTDSAYVSSQSPFVDHFTGTKRVIEYIEKYICPTIISNCLTDKPPFVFSSHKK